MGSGDYMRKLAIALTLIIATSICHASQLAECKGTSDVDGSPVTAVVSQENGKGIIVIKTSVDSTSSPTEITNLSSGAVRIFDNSFQMDFTVSQTLQAGPIQAFRGGEFFVDDFVCSLSN